jgi:hypothetical protein
MLRQSGLSCRHALLVDWQSFSLLSLSLSPSPPLSSPPSLHDLLSHLGVTPERPVLSTERTPTPYSGYFIASVYPRISAARELSDYLHTRGLERSAYSQEYSNNHTNALLASHLRPSHPRRYSGSVKSSGDPIFRSFRGAVQQGACQCSCVCSPTQS